jgi:predicted nicotinamide N-methyase
MAWLKALARSGTLVLLGDPGRAYLPVRDLEAVARYDVPTSLDLEDRPMRETTVWRVRGEH